MTAQTHAAVWIDHHEARIFHVDLDTFDESKLRAPTHHIHRHPKGLGEPREHPQDAVHFFAEVAKALASAEQILVLGPSSAKLELVKYVHEHARTLVPKIVGLETVDHPTDAQLVAYVKQYFHVSDLRVKL
jgi:stalled ribosome rescue protein Dom34